MEAEGEADTPTQEGMILLGINKPGSCPLRRVKPRGPIKGCKGACWAFEACVELTLNERDFEARAEKILEDMRKELERFDNVGRENLNPVGDS